MTDTRTYYTDTGIVVSVTGEIEKIALSDEHSLGEVFCVWNPASFANDPLRNSASDLNGRKVKRDEAIFILEGSYRYIEFSAPLSGTIYDSEPGRIRHGRADPTRQFIAMHLSDPGELEALSKVPVQFSSAMKEAYEASNQTDETHQFPSILKCLGHTGCRIFHLEKSGDKYTFTEACDWYYEATLTREQVLRLSDELRRLAERDDVDPHFLPEKAGG